MYLLAKVVDTATRWMQGLGMPMCSRMNGSVHTYVMVVRLSSR